MSGTTDRQERPPSEVAGRVPLWLRALIAVDRAVRHSQMMMSAVTEEVALAFVAPAQRDEMTRNIYARNPGYLAGGGTFAQGLFDWEIAAISADPFPPSGRVLLGGAGGGRELRALVERGYDVVAFEPSEPLAAGARRLAVNGASVVVTADYADLVNAVESKSGPLAAPLANIDIDGVILGWGSLSHVLSTEDRTKLFRAIRTVAPRAPVLLSYLVGGGPIRGRRLRFRRLLSRMTSRTPDIDDRFLPWAGFFRTVSPTELEELASQNGYALVWSRRSPYSHALLAPFEPASRIAKGASEIDPNKNRK